MGLLVLASRSPRRVELLTRAGYQFTVTPADVDEAQGQGESPETYVSRLARAKAAAIVAPPLSVVVLGADTVVVVDGDVLGKPRDVAEAGAMLRRLSGRGHEVLTGVALQSGTRVRHDVASTRVVFRELSPADIDWYVQSGEPAGKAGAYAIQGLASRFVTHIEGSYSNVVGLPIAVVDRLLRTFGVGLGAAVGAPAGSSDTASGITRNQEED